MPSPGGQSIGQTYIVEMGPAYADQFFYSLETNSVISHNARFVYDLMFDCAPGKFNIWLNTAKYMSLVKTEKTVLSDVNLSIDTIGKDFRFEIGAFDVDSNSFGTWWDTISAEPLSEGKVYIVSLGKNADGEKMGFIKMKVNGFSSDAYSITYSFFGAADSTTMLITKDENRNYAYFSFTSGTVLSDIEPDKSQWDLCFTRYTVIFYEPTFILPYEVTGVLHNPNHVSAYMDSTVLFDSVQIADFEFHRLINKRDAIGYNWKKVENMTTNFSYNLNRHYTYFIKTDEDKYYKLRFFDYYRNSQTGYPAFEFYRL